MTVSEPERWLEEHGSALYSFAMLSVHDSHRAEDLVQETLLAALKGRDKFQGKASVRTWLTGILKHKILDEFRRQSREAPAPDSEESAWETAEAQRVAESFDNSGHWKQPLADWGNSEQDYSRNQFWSIVEQCMEGLSPRLARLFMLRELWGMDTDEVCEEMSITASNLWTSLHRARLNMRQCLENNLYA